MRKIDYTLIENTIARLCVEANYELPSDIQNRLNQCLNCENNDLSKALLSDIIENYKIACCDRVPICQDTGIACVFLKIGQEVQIVGKSLYDAVNEGVRKGYETGFLRKSVVADPLFRTNTNDNTPAMIYTEITDGEQIEITVAPKGFGSENMSRVKMLKPSDGVEGVIEFVVDTIKNAGANPCPPIVVGVGIGATFDKVALLSKKALLRPIDIRNSNPYYAELEQTLLSKINELGIGVQGLGGKTTALAVNIETMPTHIAGLPCAVNVNCHVTRHKTEVI